MSRNKDIKLLHDITGKSYKKCRQLMKASGWDITKAIKIEDILPDIAKIANQTAKVIQELADRIAEIIPVMVENINMAADAVIQTIKEYQEAEDVHRDDRRSEDTGTDI